MKRNDIQVLRGLSVLAVLLFHAELVELPGGFLGVDVFFVISGFLITGIILRGLGDGTFSFTSFYMRRAKRLLPAAFATIIATIVLAVALLTPSEWSEFAAQVIGSATYTANFIIMSQTGYFSSAAEFKPLLHMWSLSLEEQYYLVIPLLLFLSSKRLRLWIIVILAGVSLAGCLVLLGESEFLRFLGLSASGAQKIAFYMLPFRAWELFAGSICAWVMLARPSLSIPSWAKYMCLLTIVFVFAVPLDSVHPRIDAVVVVVATSVIMLGDSGWLRQSRLTNALSQTGDISYSLYLVHWPLFSFATIAFVGTVPTGVRVFLVVIAFFLATLQYQLVEQRFRSDWASSMGRSTKRFGAITALVCLVALTASFSMTRGTPPPIAASISQANFGLSQSCAVSGDRFVSHEACFTGSTPQVAVWGDSYAMHLIPGLVFDPKTGASLVQITKSSCAPVVDWAQISTKGGQKWAKECIEFNNSAIDYIAASDSIEYVILSSPFTQLFIDSDQRFLTGAGVTGFDRDTAISKLDRTVSALRAMGKVPLVVAPPPVAEFNIGRCYLRHTSGRLLLGRKNCDIDAAKYLQKFEPIVHGLRAVAEARDLDVFWPSSVLCNEVVCNTKLGDTIIYRDTGHFAPNGSIAVVEALGLTDLMDLR
ncbi:MAG: acyltransferase [Gammaproteobacteria bacterium]|nr:acyltransferase [Gammaproteobacteria bacterium]